MATYTQADVDAVKAAIVALASGQRKVTVAYADRSVQYQQADLADLQQLLATMQADVNASSGTPRPRQWFGTSSKGVE
jgi:hypothetical protein